MSAGEGRGRSGGSGSGSDEGSSGDEASCRSRRGRPRSRSFYAENDDTDPITGLPTAALTPVSRSSGGSSSHSMRSTPSRGTLSHKTLDIVNNLAGAAHLGGHNSPTLPIHPGGGASTPPRLPRTASSDEEAAAERRLLEQLRASTGSAGSGGNGPGPLTGVSARGSPSVGGSGKSLLRRKHSGSSGSGAEPELLVKLLLLGDSGVGKTSLIARYTDGDFNPSTIMTAGVDYRMMHLNVDGRRVKLQIWDTAGQERFHIITRAYYKGSHGIVLVYDVSDVATQDSFKNVRYWMETIRQHAGPTNVDKVLVGNKVDLPQPRMPPSQGKALADSFGIKFFETSAKSGTNVKKMFTSITRDIVRRMAAGNGGGPGSGAGTAAGGGGASASSSGGAAAASAGEGKRGKGKGKKCHIM